ncbi:hypothetical protein [Bradyrhizobium sp. LB11.1]
MPILRPLATWRCFAKRVAAVLPNKALSRGFVFRRETLRSAFEAIL